MGLIEMPDGLHFGVPPAVYHERVLGLVSKGGLEQVDQSPMHYRAWVDGLVEDNETEALTFGRALHCALLEPDVFVNTYATQPEFGDCRFKENKAKRDAWRAENDGKEWLEVPVADAIERMVAAVHAHPLAGKMIRDGDSEVTALWRDGATGLRCRARADYFVAKRGMVVDVKTTLDASPEGFRKSAFNYRYHWQHALYREGFSALGVDARHFLFVAIEKKPPHAVGVYALDANGVSIGYGRVRSLMDRLAECVKTNEWPGYATGIQTLDTPPWAA